MGKKFSVGITVSLIAIACAITFVLTVTVTTNMFNEKIAGLNQREEIYSKLQEIDSYVRSNSLYSIDEEALTGSIVKGYVSGLADSGAEYLTADEYYHLQQKESGVLISAGIDAVREESGYLRVSYIYPGSPAQNLNISVGDIITSVDGKNVLEIGAENALKLLQGKENSKLGLTVQQNGEEIPFSITRKSFTIRSVTYNIVNSCGYIRVNAFNQLTADQFIAALEALQSQGALSYIIDVRSSEGIYSPLQTMLDPFVSARVLANVEYRDGTVKKLLETTAEPSVKAPVVVMIDGNTKGAAELFASSMKCCENVKLVGSQSLGFDLLTEKKAFSDGSALVITTARIIPVVQDSYENGIKPDFSVETGSIIDTNPQSTTTSDPQLQKAFEVIESQK